MFEKFVEDFRGERAIIVKTSGETDLRDTFECGQAFRYELIKDEDGYAEYMTVVGDLLIRVGQRERGELIFFGITDEEFESVCVPYFALDTDFVAIRDEIISKTDSEWLKRAAMSAGGISILRQEPWEALFSFIISQNNNIPRIRKIIRSMSLAYGENLAKKRQLKGCPLGKTEGIPCSSVCSECGACYSFPRPEQVLASPEKMLPSKPGFRYKYLLSAAERVVSGETNLSKISKAASYEYTLAELKKILGVGDKVASCVALFGFTNLEAFPIDVWMRRAIDEYFDGNLDPKSLGKYAGVAQQYIFHYIRNLENNVN